MRLWHRFLVCWLVLLAGSATATRLHAADPLSRWQVRTSGTSADLDGVAYGHGRFVAVGDDGVILSSVDGASWTPETSPTTRSLDFVMFSQGTFFALSRNGVMLTSPDGRQWTDQKYSLGSGPLRMIHDGQRFVLIKVGGGLNVSTNGVDWFPAGDVPNAADVSALAYGQGTYVEVGYKKSGALAPDLFVTPQLASPWTPVSPPASENLVNVVYVLGQFLALGQGGTLLTSPDGVDWAPRNSQTTGFLWDVATEGQHLVAVGQWGRILVSTDGASWVRHETDVPGHLKSVAFGAQTFVAVGWDGAIVQSDPVAVGPGPGDVTLSQPAWFPNEFRFWLHGVVGQSYRIEGSTNGTNWESVGTVNCAQAPMPVSLPGPTSLVGWYRARPL